MLPLTDIRTKDLLYGSVITFGDSVCLWVVSCRHAQLCTQQIPQRSPEFTGKTCVSIAHDRQWNTVVFSDLVKEDHGVLLDANALSRGRQVDHLGSSIHEHRNGIVAIRRLW